MTFDAIEKVKRKRARDNENISNTVHLQSILGQKDLFPSEGEETSCFWEERFRRPSWFLLGMNLQLVLSLSER
jgi:hypothetical protein